MKYIDLITEAMTRPGDPYSKLDIDNKVYIVYDGQHNEISRYVFKHVWDSSPARDAAQKEVSNLIVQLRKSQSEDLAKKKEAIPLSDNEKLYLDLHSKFKKYFALLYPLDKSPSILDDEAKEVYGDQLDKWSERLDKLSNSGIIRKSVIMGTYQLKS